MKGNQVKAKAKGKAKAHIENASGKPQQNNVMPFKQGLSKIEAHEVEDAQKLVRDELEKCGVKNVPVPTGWWVCVKTYIRPENYRTGTREDGSTYSIILADVSRAEDQYTSIAALVIAVGPEAYSDKVRFPNGPWCRVGDWVVVPRNEGFLFFVDGIPMQMLPDDKIVAVIVDPAEITASYMKPKI